MTRRHSRGAARKTATGKTLPVCFTREHNFCIAAGVAREVGKLFALFVNTTTLAASGSTREAFVGNFVTVGAL